MARLTIPERHRAGVALIRQLDADSVRAIRLALDSVLAERTLDEGSPSERGTEDLVASMVTTVPRMAKSDLRKIADALISLYAAKAVREIALEEFVERISDALESLDSGEAKLPPDERKQFRDNLTTLLSADMFGIAAKVVDLRTDDERVFCRARILTDLRPVFGSRIEDGPQGMVVVHLLKLAYHSASEEHPEFFVSLDSDDLQTLRKLIDRAEAKARSLKSHLKNTRLFGIAKD